MVLPGHLAGGYLVSTALITALHPDFSATQLNILLLIGTLSGELPDIDLLFFNLKNRNKAREEISTSENHRNFITHVPLFWLAISAVIYLLGMLFDSKLTEYIGILILGGTLSHFIFDSIEYGITWLAPWSKKRFAISDKMPKEDNTDRPGSIKQYFHFIIKSYWKTYTIWCELVVTLVAVFVFFKSF
jgi:inner membrane protein